MRLSPDTQFNHVQDQNNEGKSSRVVDLKLPENEGVFIWKTKIGKHDVVFPARMRQVFGGHKGISPDFDHWTGYTYIVPNISLAWANNDGCFDEPKFKEHSCEKELRVIGAPLHKCPFCEQEPTIQFDWKADIPNTSSSFTVKCCSWISSPRFNTLDQVIDAWNSKIKPQD